MRGIPAGGGSLILVCALAVLTLVEFRLFFLLHIENLHELGVAAYDVTAGTPQWRAFQSRLLAPYAIAASASVTGLEYDTAHKLALVILLIGANLTAFTVFTRLSGSAQVAFRYTLYFMVAFVALTADSWVFVWDFADMVIFTLLAYGVFTGRSWRFFVPLFLVAILNRESALFIAAWVIIDAVMQRRPPQLAAGTIMAAAGVAYTILVRQALFIRSSLEEIPTFVEMPVVGNQWNVVESARRAAIHLLNPRFDMVFLVHIGYVAFAAYFAYHWRMVRAHYLAPFVLVAAMFVAVPVFGLFDETRQYAYLVPMLLAFNLVLSGKLAEN